MLGGEDIMKFYLTFEYLKDLIVTNAATKKQKKLYNKMLKKDIKRLEPRASWF